MAVAEREVLIFLHMDDDGPGYIADFLTARKIPYRILRSYLGDEVPPWSPAMLGLVFMGGIMSANDDIPWLREELRLIGRALQEGTPLLGHCLGGQLISKAAGASISANPVAEIGWHRCRGTQTSIANNWLGDLPVDFQMFHWHYEQFSLPEPATLIFSVSAHISTY